MRYVLGIDTASRFGSIALAGDGVAEAWEVLAPGEHSSGLTHAAERLLCARDLTPRGLAGVAVSEGPGSFTGLRIGLAWAKGLCFGSKVALALVSAHEVHAHRHRHEAAALATVLPGERGEVLAAIWSGGVRAALLWGPARVADRALPPTLREALGAASPGSGGTAGGIAVVGPDLSPILRELLAESGFNVLDPAGGAAAVSPRHSPLAAAAVAELGDRDLLAGSSVDLASAAPAYGREPNARRPGS